MAKRKAVMPRITEAEFTTQVIALFRIYGWRVCHFRPAKTKRGWRTALQGDPGFGDIVAARSGRKVFIELKVGKNKLTEDQKIWLAAWGSDGYVFRPADWKQIEALASGRA